MFSYWIISTLVLTNCDQYNHGLYNESIAIIRDSSNNKSLLLNLYPFQMVGCYRCVLDAGTIYLKRSAHANSRLVVPVLKHRPELQAFQED